MAGDSTGADVEVGHIDPYVAPTPDELVSDTRQLLSTRIRQLRQARGFSTATLAGMAGVTGAMVSQVERGVTNPSVATVARIAAALGVSVSELLEMEQPKGMVVRSGDRRRIAYPNVDIVDEYISSDPTRQLLVLETRVGPMQGTDAQLAAHGAAVEFVLVLSGTVEVSVGDQVYVLDERDTLTFDGKFPHGFANRTTSDVRMLWITAPATF